MAMLRWEPFREMENALRRFSPLYMPDDGTTRNETAARTWIPLANISESENEYLIKVELPDVKKEDVKIAVADGVITISGERKEERKENGATRTERSTGKFRRSITIPTRVDANKVNATYKNGILTVTLPKAEEAKPKQIQINLN